MLEDFYIFDTKRFLKESKGWARQKKYLQSQLDEITMIVGSLDSPIRCSGVSDPVARLVNRRLELMSRIDEIETLEKIYRDALEKVAPTTKNVILIVRDGKQKSARVAELCETTPSKAGKIIADALNEFGETILSL